ncbi:hypothetical protein LOD99_14939 [Oopsacas minuta]|uniref:Uncharacterized protein n=1 Tax=Oopsacas minuta TaxID=111878 RepID=A0AAV7KDW5_9METZ|nr:hypothetical protein LOD99_14939 [Oopsacas minuta]
MSYKISSYNQYVLDKSMFLQPPCRIRTRSNNQDRQGSSVIGSTYGTGWMALDWILSEKGEPGGQDDMSSFAAGGEAVHLSRRGWIGVNDRFFEKTRKEWGVSSLY